MSSIFLPAQLPVITFLTTVATLPVKLINFKAGQQITAIVFNWTIETEANSQYYIVEKSTDGNAFAEKTRVRAMGNE